jgi:very-short-patch-repair endonuclease
VTRTERLLFDAFLMLGFREQYAETCEREAFHAGWFMELEAQIPIERFRFDFALGSRVLRDDGSDPWRFIIEIDGPEHDSRIYRRKDRERDRLLALFGATTVRYTNAQVQDDAHDCACQIMEAAIARQRPHLDEQFTKFMRREGQYKDVSP